MHVETTYSSFDRDEKGSITSLTCSSGEISLYTSSSHVRLSGEQNQIKYCSNQQNQRKSVARY